MAMDATEIEKLNKEGIGEAQGTMEEQRGAGAAYRHASRRTGRAQRRLAGRSTQGA